LKSTSLAVDTMYLWVQFWKKVFMLIWVNEQLDPGGLMYSCIASLSEEMARDCHESYKKDLSDEQKKLGWIARLRTVNSWDEVPVNSLKLG
jgi:hypothetical protein